MNTLKSAALVVVLAGVLYGVYVTLNHPPVTPPPGMTQQQLDDLGPPQIGEGDEGHDHAAADPDHHSSESVPLAESDRSIYGTSAAPPVTDLADANPADPSTGTEGRALSHSEPIINERGSGASVYSSPLPGAAQAPGSVDAEAAKRRLAVHSFKRDWEAARQQIDAGEFRAALATLSPHYAGPGVPPEHEAQLTAWLDALAAKVIYSREHLLQRPYKVRGTQSRMIDVASEFDVSAQLLQNINAEVVNNPDVLLPGTELKVVPGPFRAVVNLSRGEITIYLGALYAGRFPFARGDEPIINGQFQVQRKLTLPTYVGSDGRSVPGNDPANPYGQFCLQLGSEMRIHGSPLIAAGGRTRGCISLSPKDAEDLYGILTVGSVVTIQ